MMTDIAGIPSVAALALIAAIFALDVTAFGQFMISRPIVCGPLFGYLLGDLKTGLWIGIVAELIWIGAIPMGAAIPPDTTAITILTTVWSAAAFPGCRSAAIFALAVAVPAGLLSRKADIWTRYFNVRIVHWVEEGVAAGKESRIGKGVWLGLLCFFLKSFIFYAALLYPGKILLLRVYPLLGERLLMGLDQAWLFLPMAGFGLLFVNLRHDKFPCNRISS